MLFSHVYENANCLWSQPYGMRVLPNTVTRDVCLTCRKVTEPPNTPQVRWPIGQIRQKSVGSCNSPLSCVCGINQKKMKGRSSSQQRDGVSSWLCPLPNLQYVNPGGISWMLSAPCVIGVTKLLSVHQLCCVGRLDSTVKSPHRTQRCSHLLRVWMTDSRGCCAFIGLWVCISH